LDWDKIVHKNMRSKNNEDSGNVAAVDEDSITVMSEGARNEYKIPKSAIEGFDGAEVFLKLSIAELKNYKV
jgi:ribosome maturation factor RimP